MRVNKKTCGQRLKCKLTQESILLKDPDIIRQIWIWMLLKKGKIEDPFIETIEKRVQEFNTPKWRRKKMTLEHMLEIENEKGRAEGHAEEKISIAKNLLAEGLSIELISKTTGLDKAEIEKLSKEE